jgi:acyl-CoA thioesterase-1
MRIAGLSILAALALAGCNREAAMPQPTPSAVSSATEPVSGPGLAVLAFGDSLFAGRGLADPESESYPAQLEAALRKSGHNVRVTNAGVSGDTTAAGLQRFAFTLDSQPKKPDLVILELGGNDLLRGLPLAQTKANLTAMLAELKKRKIPAVLMGLQAPPNYGPQFQAQFDALYPALAKQFGAALVPFVTAKVFTDPRLIQSDHIHPTARGVGALVDATERDVAKALPKPAGG